MDFSNYSWQDYPDTHRNTGAYIIFYQGGPIDYGTHVPGIVPESSEESEYNAACTARMYLVYFSMLIRELLNKDPDIVPEGAPLIVMYSNSDICMAKNGKYNKHTRHISWIIIFVSNREK